ncbi:hypothetical protein WN55_04086 [Dufourea novaeangliae]|uniref:Uncharacterized protein n=1 Tax=Dufourea novaeangliae TaxID=178035 RepID=A0A154PKB5_DUFNO|nr:hypothetical protein WN55_04086 [Dufourea novaeangliae]
MTRVLTLHTKFEVNRSSRSLDIMEAILKLMVMRKMRSRYFDIVSMEIIISTTNPPTPDHAEDLSLLQKVLLS